MTNQEKINQAICHSTLASFLCGLFGYALYKTGVPPELAAGTALGGGLLTELYLSRHVNQLSRRANQIESEPDSGMTPEAPDSFTTSQ